MENASKENCACTGKKLQGTANSAISVSTHMVIKSLKSMIDSMKSRSDSKEFTQNRIARSSIRRNIAALAADAPSDMNIDPTRRFTDTTGSHNSKV